MWGPAGAHLSQHKTPSQLHRVLLKGQQSSEAEEIQLSWRINQYLWLCNQKTFFQQYLDLSRDRDFPKSQQNKDHHPAEQSSYTNKCGLLHKESAISTSPWMTEILKHPNSYLGFSFWCHMAKPWPLAHRQPLWPSHANGRATQKPWHGSRKGSGTMGQCGAPSHMTSSPAPLQEHSWLEPPSHPSPPPPLQRWQGDLGHDPQGKLMAGLR